MNINFLDALNEMKRRALLTGRMVTPQEKKGMTAGWFDAAAETSAKTRALELAKKNQAIMQKQAEDQLKQNQWTTQAQMDTARKNQASATISNVAKDAISTVGMDYLKAKPGESMISKGIDIGKEAVGKIGNWFGTGKGMVAPVEAGADVTGLSGVGGETLAPSIAPVAEVAAPAAAEGASTLGSVAGSVGSGVLTAAPYYALAKGGGMLINAITDKNPNLKETPFGRLGRTLKNPVTGVEREWGGMLQEAGVGDIETNEAIAGIFNPAGGIIEELGGGCIIITACTDKNSPEVQIAREYRDKFLDKTQLRGYYILAERIVPLLERNEKARKFCKKWLVDKLVYYGEKRLGKKQRPCKLMSFVVSKLFLAMIKIAGVIIPHYTRKNGEVY